jgi:hypothetical protein
MLDADERRTVVITGFERIITLPSFSILIFAKCYDVIQVLPWRHRLLALLCI